MHLWCVDAGPLPYSESLVEGRDTFCVCRTQFFTLAFTTAAAPLVYLPSTLMPRLPEPVL